MSFFKSEAIVLSMKKSPDGIQIFTLFSREFGVILVKKKLKSREKSLDIGYKIHSEIHTKNTGNIHSFGNIKIKSHLRSEILSFREIKLFLYLLHTIKKELPLGNPHYEIYDAIGGILDHEPLQNYESIILLTLKVQSLLGKLGETHPDTNVQKILKFVHREPISHILKLKNIPEETLEYLEKIILN